MSQSVIRMVMRTGFLSVLVLSVLLLAACGGGGGDSNKAAGTNNGGTTGETTQQPAGNPDANNDNTPPAPSSGGKAVSLSGGSVKGPLANAYLAFYEFDETAPDFQAASPAATGVTNSQAAFDGVLIPAPKPPYILVFTANANTIDLTTGTSPVITTMKTVVTSEMLSKGYPIYATPLTTLAVDLAIANANASQAPYNFPKQPLTVDNFLIAANIAAHQVASNVGFGLSKQVDIFQTWPVVGADSSPEALQATAEYRTAVEAFSTLVYQMAQSAGTDADQMLQALAADMGDGVIDGVDANSQAVPGLGAAELALLTNADPASLTIPNSTVLVGDVESLLAGEAAAIGATADTTALANGTIQVTLQAAQLDSDIDGDGVLNVDDAFPTDPARDTDTDGDGLADIFWIVGTSGRTGLIDTLNSDSDDDNDGLSDTDEANLGTDPLLPDTDGDGILDSVENTAVGSTLTLVNMVFNGIDFSGTYNGTGTDPLVSDSDSDGVLDGVEVAAPGATLVILTGPNAGTYTGIGTNPLLSDTDGDGLNDGAEVDALTDPLVTDSDADGATDSVDNCPAVANPTQLDSNADGVGDACSADLTGIWRLSFAPTTMTWNACDKSKLGKSYVVYQTVTQDTAGALAAVDHRGLGMNGAITVGTNRFTLAGSGTEVDPRFGLVKTRTLNLAARVNLDGSISGNYELLDEIDGTAVCLEAGAVTATYTYDNNIGTGTGNPIDGIYAVEYKDGIRPRVGLQPEGKQSSGIMELLVRGSNFEMHEAHPGATVLSNSYDPATGTFQESTLRETVMDVNQDGFNDLVRETSDLTGLKVRPQGDNSGAAIIFARNINKATYFNLTAYDPNVSPNYVDEQRLEGYGRLIGSSAANDTLTRPNADGSLAMVDRLRLSNPPLQVATAASALRFEAFAGTDTSVAPLCSVPFEPGLQLVQNYPLPDMSTEAIRSGDFASVACEVGPAGTVVPGALYTLAVWDDMGTPADNLDDQLVTSLPLTAAATSPAPAAIPDRRNMQLGGAAASQTQSNEFVAIDGYLNPYVANTLSWPDLGASEYVLHLRTYDQATGQPEHHETRITSTTNSVVVPAGAFDDENYTALELTARYDNTLAGTSAYASSRQLTVFPSINGLFNVELSDSGGGPDVNFQLAIQRSGRNGMLCKIVHSNIALGCESFFMFANWATNTASIHFDDPAAVMTGSTDFYMTFQFTDAMTATVTAGTYQGTARHVTTELVARTQVLADGTEGTVLTVENPLPLFDGGELTSQSGTVDLDGLPSTVVTLWNDADTDPSNDFAGITDAFWEHPASDVTPPAVATAVGFHSADLTAASYVLPSGGYKVTFLNQQWLGAPDTVFAVDYSAATTAMTAMVQGPMMAAISVNGALAGAGVGDTFATAVDVSLQSAFDLAWNTGADAATLWAIVIHRVDVDGSVTGTIGQLIPGQEWRSPFMDPAVDASLTFTMPDSWSWVNGGALDLATYLAPGQVAQVQLVSRDAGGSVQGLSDPVYVRLGP